MVHSHCPGPRLRQIPISAIGICVICEHQHTILHKPFFLCLRIGLGGGQCKHTICRKGYLFGYEDANSRRDLWFAFSARVPVRCRCHHRLRVHRQRIRHISRQTRDHWRGTWRHRRLRFVVVQSRHLWTSFCKTQIQESKLHVNFKEVQLLVHTPMCALNVKECLHVPTPFPSPSQCLSKFNIVSRDDYSAKLAVTIDTMIILGDGQSTAVLPRCYRGGLPIARYDQC